MDARTLRVLEYDKALALLAAQAATALGKAKCLRLRPRTDRTWVEARLEETSQARELLTHPALGAPPGGGNYRPDRDAGPGQSAGHTDARGTAGGAGPGRRLPENAGVF